MRALLRHLIRNDRGATAIEYAMVTAIMGAMLIAAFSMWPKNMYGLSISAIQNSQ